MKARPQEPKRIWWARPRKLCGLERPGGGGRSHRPERREAEIAYLVARGVRLCVSTLTTRHNLAAYEAAGARVAPRAGGGHRRRRRGARRASAVPARAPADPGAVAVHGNRYTDFAAAVCAAHLHDVRGIAPADALASAARAGLAVTPAACALLGVPDADVQERLEALVP